MQGINQIFEHSKPIIGVVHLLPLIGNPMSTVGLTDVRSRALSDTAKLVDNCIDGVLVENYGDVPFFPDHVGAHTVASMTIIAHELREQYPQTPIGINVLRNDAVAAMAIASAAQLEFIRVNIHCGAMLTDQGLIQGKAHETLRYRSTLHSDVKIFADLSVKHAAPLVPVDLTTSAEDTFGRGLADALVITGTGTGKPADVSDLQEVKETIPNAQVFVGSGITPATINDFLQYADGAIIGTWFKRDGVTTNEVDASRVESLIGARG